ncbi:hypothetical protein FHU30_002763 [Actinomadura rupiterrae]|nr:hypothetical protein [Actinomadura rupiterrae]
MFALPHSATRLVPSRIVLQARSSATSADEHAVSTAMLGPRSPKKCDSRFAAIEDAAPAIVYALTVSVESICNAP